MNTIESDLLRLIGEAGWRSKSRAFDIAGHGRAYSVAFDARDDAPGMLAYKPLHAGVLLDDFDTAEDVFAEFMEMFARAGDDEDADGWRTSFNPVTGDWYRNNVYGETAR